jgi:tetratricopeptide (TPR) repeat protein
MSNVASGPPPRVAPQVYDAIRALLRADKNDEAIVKLCAIAVILPDDLDTKELLFDAFFQKRDWLPALALAEELVRRRPDIARLQKALVATLSNMKRYDEAIVKASQYIERHGEEITILDALKVANFNTGKVDEAIRYGQRGIELRDAEAAKIPRTMSMMEPRGQPSGDHVISFSLWGPAPFYGSGA